MRRFIFFFLVVGLLGACSSTATAPSFELSMTAGSYYHGVYPGSDTGDESDISLAHLQSYETLAGRKAAWVYFSNEWYKSRAFPWATAKWIRETGSLPFIRLMLRSSPEISVEETTFSLERIVAGELDDDLRAWGKAAANFGTPLIVEWGGEMNGYWFHWNAYWHGKEAGTELYKQAYRHIVETMRGEGASNITWVFHVNGDDDPSAAWNRFENYYPGHDVINWIGISMYSAQTPYDSYWTNFRTSMDALMPRLDAMSDGKPVFLIELGAPAYNALGRSVDWVDGALGDILANRWDTLRGFSWWNEAWANDTNPAHDTDMRLETVPGLAEVFQRRLATPRVLERFTFE
ncbi:MAG: hypothetical protein KC422_00655 [Trueperaceae bacterium]|nr:hypothetical protein [Trueperaceae bacterium]